MNGEANRSFKIFDFFIRALALLHWFWLFVFKYYYFSPTDSFRHAIFDMFSHDSTLLHSGIFWLYTIFTFLFAIKATNYLWAFLISACLFYFEFHDKYSFHQDIFLAINIFLIFTFAKYFDEKKNFEIRDKFIFLLKLLCSIVYFFAGVHKINDYFHTGILLDDMLESGNLRFFFSQIPNSISKGVSYVTLFVELLFPVLIWTKWKRLAIILAILVHSGIAFFAMRGMLFNLYLPTLWILFFSFNTVHNVPFQLKGFLKRIDIFGSLSTSVNYERKKPWRLFTPLFYNFIFVNPIFIVCLSMLCFNLFFLIRLLMKSFIL
tara:strand:- start:1124 stop:2083 length:960 start_codon:yes stop_codon:yes gene_type:complete